MIALPFAPGTSSREVASEAKLRARADLDAPPLAELAMLDDATFRLKFSGSPIKRIGRNRFVRNVLIAIGNSGDPSFLPLIEPLCGDGSSLVSEMAAWAKSRLLV